jgi:hypothetical protein
LPDTRTQQAKRAIALCKSHGYYQNEYEEKQCYCENILSMHYSIPKRKKSFPALLLAGESSNLTD